MVKELKDGSLPHKHGVRIGDEICQVTCTQDCNNYVQCTCRINYYRSPYGIHLRGRKFIKFYGGASIPQTPLDYSLCALPFAGSKSVPPPFLIPGSAPAICTCMYILYRHDYVSITLSLGFMCMNYTKPYMYELYQPLFTGLLCILYVRAYVHACIYVHVCSIIIHVRSTYMYMYMYAWVACIVYMNVMAMCIHVCTCTCIMYV